MRKKSSKIFTFKKLEQANVWQFKLNVQPSWIINNWKARKEHEDPTGFDRRTGAVQWQRKNIYVQEIRHIATVLTNTNNLVLNFIRKLHSFKLLSANYCHSMALKTSLVLASSLKSGS